MSRPKYTKEQLLNYYKKQAHYNQVIRRDVKQDKEIVYGAQAFNAQVPSYLRKKTEDWDIFVQKPRQEAKELETMLDKAYGGNYFYIKKAQHPGTYKVESYVTGKGVADYTAKPARTPYIVKQQTRYVPLSWIEKGIKKTLKDPESKYRWSKDIDTLQRLKLVKGRKS